MVVLFCTHVLEFRLKANDVVFCGRILMFLAHFFPLSERSGTCLSSTLVFTCLLTVLNPNLLLYLIAVVGWLMFAAVNIKGVFNTSNETKYEKDAPDGTSLINNCLIF